jgi:hypothetical protein
MAPFQLFVYRYHDLQRDTAIRRVLKENATVNLALIQVLGLIAIVNDVCRSSGLLEYAELELAATSKVGGFVGCNSLEFGGAGGVVDCNLATKLVSMRFLNV